jgi:hypothetical protein
VALATADDAPRIVVDNRKILLASWSKGVVKVVTEPSRLLPSIFRIAKEHAQKMTSAGLAIGTAVRLTGMHNAQVIEELYVTLLAVNLGTEALRKLLNSMHSMQLLVSDHWHARIALNQGCAQQRSFHQLAHRPAFGEEECWAVLEVWIFVPTILLAIRLE